MEEGCSYRGNRNINSADCGIMIHKTGGSGTGNTAQELSSQSQRDKRSEEECGQSALFVEGCSEKGSVCANSTDMYIYNVATICERSFSRSHDLKQHKPKAM